MGSGASVSQDLDAETFEIIQKEYRRLTDEGFSDEDIFIAIRDTIALRTELKTARELVTDEESPVETLLIEAIPGIEDAILPPEVGEQVPDAIVHEENDVGDRLGVLSSRSSSSFDLTQNLTPVFTTDVMTDPTTLRMFISYAERNKIPHGVDMLRFWVEIDELQLLPSHSYTHRRLRKIYDKFLSAEAPSPVCVTKSMLQEIEKALESDNISAGMYADAQAICLKALEESVYPRFRDSKLFKKMQDFCAPVVANDGKRKNSVQPPEDYSLHGILMHPAKLRFLKSFCMEALALENLLFYLEVEDCKRLPNLSFVTNKTRKIYDRYCQPNSKNFIPLDDHLLAPLHESVETKHALFPKLFYEAQVVIFNRISEELWKGFCRTQEYLEHSRQVKPETKRKQRAGQRFARLQEDEIITRKLSSMDELQLIDTAMHYPVIKLIPIQYQVNPDLRGSDPALKLQQTTEDELTPQELLTTILSDTYAKKYFKQFMKKRGVEQCLAFCEEVEDFKLLPGIEFLQHSAKKIYRKYIDPSARLQVDMSKAMRDEIADKLLSPTVDMFKKIAARIRHGLLQDSLPRFVKSQQYTDLKRQTTAARDVQIANELKEVDAAAKRGKLDLSHLDVFLQNPACIGKFKIFCQLTHCSENLMLWEEIEHYRRLPSYQIVLRSARKIYDKYLNPSTTKMTLSVPSSVHQRVVSQLDVASRTTFDEIERECHEQMRNVVVPDFLDSRIFMALVGTWSVVDEEYPAEMLRGEFEMAFLRHRFHLVQGTKGMGREASISHLDRR